jgi:hypothetical protein
MRSESSVSHDRLAAASCLALGLIRTTSLLTTGRLPERTGTRLVPGRHAAVEAHAPKYVILIIAVPHPEVFHCTIV